MEHNALSDSWAHLMALKRFYNTELLPKDKRLLEEVLYFLHFQNGHSMNEDPQVESPAHFLTCLLRVESFREQTFLLCMQKQEMEVVSPLLSTTSCL